MIFDALIGEQDRHEENWGITLSMDYQIKLSPLYDNGCSLLNKFRNSEFAEKFYSGIKDFDAYIKNSKTLIYKEDNLTRYKHFELIEYFKKDYGELLKEEVNNLKKLTDNKIKNIVSRVPDNLLTDFHKKYIIDYLIKRRDILIKIMG